MTDRPPPRRFGYVFEFDRNGGPAAGTPEQQTAIRDLIRRTILSTPKFDRLLHSLAVKIKTWTPYLPISWVVDMGANGYTFPYLMLLNANLQPSAWLDFVFMHELGHLVGRHLLNPADRTEPWADEIANWVLAGAPDYPTIEARIVHP